MRIDIYQKNIYHIFRIQEDVGLHSDLSELKQQIDRKLLEGARHIVVSFTKNSYLYTRSIAVLIACLESIKDHDGSLAIMEANKDIFDILSVIDFDKMIKIVKSESELGVPTPA